jgi:CheY-like chemotaxis protein
VNEESNKILVYVIEDSRIICDIMSRLVLFNKNIEVKTFYDGQTALAAVTKKWPDIIFLDYYLDNNHKHGINGDVVLRTIKRVSKDTPVILMTSLTDGKKINTLLRIGFDGFIHKGEENLMENIVGCVNKFAGTN